MIRCPSCSHPVTSVIDSRSHHNTIRRRRRCKGCLHTFNTTERVHSTYPTNLQPREQRLLDLLKKNPSGLTPAYLLKTLPLKNLPRLSELMSDLRGKLEPYGYTITSHPYRLKVLSD